MKKKITLNGEIVVPVELTIEYEDDGWCSLVELADERLGLTENNNGFTLSDKAIILDDINIEWSHESLDKCYNIEMEGMILNPNSKESQVETTKIKEILMEGTVTVGVSFRFKYDPNEKNIINIIEKVDKLVDISETTSGIATKEGSLSLISDYIEWGEECSDEVERIEENSQDEG